MKKSIFAVALLVMCAFAQAGFVPADPNVPGSGFQCTFPDDPQTQRHTWDFTIAADGSGDLNLYEKYTTTGSDSVNMAAVTDSDPIVRATKYVENSNGHTWTGYTLTLNGPADVYFTGVASSDKFATATVTPNLITFSNGTVAVGQEVALSFRIEVANSGSFGWCVTQQAIPEPATMSILGLGALALFRRK